MAKKSKVVSKRRTFTVVAHLPASVELSLRGTKNILHVDVTQGKLKGKLYIAQGSIQWWSSKAKDYAHHSDWPEFIKLLEELPKRHFYRR
jgi:hypothetical protein